MNDRPVTTPEKLCPFCGSVGEIYADDGRTITKHYVASIRCVSCDDVAQEAFGATKQEAIENAASAWNKRHD
jgi:hypothetical protein